MTHRTSTHSETERAVTEKWYMAFGRFMWWLTWNALFAVTWPALLLVLLAGYVLLSILSLPAVIYEAWEKHEKCRQEQLRSAS